MVEATGILRRLIAAATLPASDEATASIKVPSELCNEGETASRAHVAMALNMLLFADLLARVPTAATFVASVAARGESIQFDHGALRTIDGPTGALPRGIGAFARILGPLGYDVGGTYPLPRLRMTGTAFTHRDFPEEVPQFFVSELHVAQLPGEAQAAARNVFDNSVDPLGPVEQLLLETLANEGSCPLDLATRGLPGLFHAFARQHPPPALADYEALLPHSAEAAWIATEGNAFNHATDRLADVGALAASLQEEGYRMKPEVEVSANGRVRQTAFIADKVLREFRLPDGSQVAREVPGSFYEFISRDVDPATGRLDLSFDSGNATGIFSVTSVR